MRGLLFTGGSRPDMLLAAPFFGNWDVVYAADSGVAGAHEAGLDPDYIVGDMDSIEDASILDAFAPERIVRAERDKDLTDTELALALMRKNGIDDIVLIGGGGGRMDHFFALERLFSGAFPPRLWIGSLTVAYVLDACGPRDRITLKGLSDETVSLFPVGSGPFHCNADGLKWPVDTLDWDSGAYSLSNRAEQGVCSVRALEGRFMMILPLSGGYSSV